MRYGVAMWLLGLPLPVILIALFWGGCDWWRTGDSQGSAGNNGGHWVTRGRSPGVRPFQTSEL